jgi:hypothetical protein
MGVRSLKYLQMGIITESEIVQLDKNQISRWDALPGYNGGYGGSMSIP